VNFVGVNLYIYTTMTIVTHYVGQNDEKQIQNISTKLLNQDQLAKLLSNRDSIAGNLEVLDLSLNRASRSAKHVKKYLDKRYLDPFEFVVGKN
jgi:hypothetical protein